MNKDAKDKITERLIPLAVKAVLDEDKAKRIAMVNSRDNFALCFHRSAKNAMLNDVIRVLDGPKGKARNDEVDWLNAVCATGPNKQRSELHALASKAAGMAYDELRKEGAK